MRAKSGLIGNVSCHFVTIDKLTLILTEKFIYDNLNTFDSTCRNSPVHLGVAKDFLSVAHVDRSVFNENVPDFTERYRRCALIESRYPSSILN